MSLPTNVVSLTISLNASGSSDVGLFKNIGGVCDIVWGTVRVVTTNLSAHGQNVVSQGPGTWGSVVITDLPLTFADWNTYGDPVLVVYIFGLSPDPGTASFGVDSVHMTATNTLGQTVTIKPTLAGWVDQTGNPASGTGGGRIGPSFPGGNAAAMGRGPFGLFTSLVTANYSFMTDFQKGIPPWFAINQPDWLIIDEPTIGYTDRTQYLFKGSGFQHSFTLQLRQRGQAQVQLYVAAGDSYAPTQFTQFFLYDQTLTYQSPATSVWHLAFSGLIQDVENQWIGSKGDRFVTATAVSFESIFDTVYAQPVQYQNQTCGAILTDLFGRFEQGSPVQLGTVQDGPVVPLLVTNYERLSDLFDELATTAQFVWFVDPSNQQLNFMAPASNPAPFTLRSSNILWDSINWKESGADYRNRQAVRLSYDAFAHSCEFFVGAGQRTITLMRPVQQVTNAWATLSTCNTATGTFSGQPAVGDTVSIAIPTGTWLPAHIYALNGVLIDVNGFAQKVTTAGTSGGSLPTFSVITGGTTIDGTVIWTCLGPAGLATGNAVYTFVNSAPAAAWAASTAYAAGALVNASNFAQQASVGTSGTTQPVFSTTTGGTVTDGTVTWTCLGPCLDNTQYGQVAIGTSDTVTCANLMAAINASFDDGASPATQLRGISYSLPTWENALCNAINIAAGPSFTLQQKHAGTGWLSALSATGTAFTWSAAQTSGGTSPQGSLGPGEGATISLQVYVAGTSVAAPGVAYTPGSTVVTLATPLNVGSNLNIEYTRADGNIIEVENTPLVTALAARSGGTGKYQQIVDASSQGLISTSNVAGLQLAQQALASFSVIPQQFKFVCYDPGLLPGQTLTSGLILPTGSASLLGSVAAPIQWIIEEVEAELVPVDWNVAAPYLPGFGHYRYTVQCFNLAQIGSWSDFWKGRGGGSGGGGGGGGGAVLAATTGGGLVPSTSGLPQPFGSNGSALTANSAVTAGADWEFSTIITFLMTSGATGTNLGPILIYPRAGQVNKCKFVTKLSDGAIDLTFVINKNGTSVFTAPQTIAHSTGGGTITTITALTSVPLAIAADDKFTIDISSGSANWSFTVQLET